MALAYSPLRWHRPVRLANINSTMASNVLLGPRSAELVLHFYHGLAPQLRAPLIEEAGRSDLGQLRIDETVASSLGIGGGPGFGADLIVHLTEQLAQQVAPRLAVEGVLDALKALFGLVKRQVAHRTLRIQYPDKPTVTYLVLPTNMTMMRSTPCRPITNGPFNTASPFEAGATAIGKAPRPGW